MEAGDTVSELASLVPLFITQELVFRRMYTRDPGFREICEHYEAARAALSHFEAPDTASAIRAEEYRQILAELEAEIATILAANEPRL